MKHIFIINPVAGKTDRSEQIVKEAESVFSGSNDEYVIEVTGYSGNATEIAKRYSHSGEKSIFYACGGDGTLNEVLNGIYGDPNAIITHVPIGTGNDFIKVFGKDSYEHFRDIGNLKNGVAMEIDILQVADRYCINLASAGLDSAIAKNVERFKRYPIISGHGSYVMSVIYSMFTSIKNNYALEIDGKLHSGRDYTFVVAANGLCYGGGFYAAPDSQINDGMIDIVTVPTVSRWNIARFMGTYKRGEHIGKVPGVDGFRCRSLKILSTHPIDLNIDGEIYRKMNPEIVIYPSSIKFLVPKELIKSDSI